MLTRSEVCKQFGITERTLRYYSEKGLLKETNQDQDGLKECRYDEKAVETLRYIMLLKQLGYKLSDIKEIITKPDFNLNLALGDQIDELKKERDRIERLIEYAYCVQLYGKKLMLDINIKNMDEKKREWLDLEGIKPENVSINNDQGERFGQLIEKGIDFFRKNRDIEMDDAVVVKTMLDIYDDIHSVIPEYTPLVFFGFCYSLTGDGVVSEILDDGEQDIGEKFFEASAIVVFREYLRDLKKLATPENRNDKRFEYRTIEKLKNYNALIGQTVPNPFAFYYLTYSLIEKYNDVADMVNEGHINDDEQHYLIELIDAHSGKMFKLLIKAFGDFSRNNKVETNIAFELVDVLQDLINKLFNDCDLERFRKYSNISKTPELVDWVDGIGGKGTSEYISNLIIEYCDEKECVGKKHRGPDISLDKEKAEEMGLLWGQKGKKQNSSTNSIDKETAEAMGLMFEE